jgi:hypothetical protein
VFGSQYPGQDFQYIYAWLEEDDRQMLLFRGDRTFDVFNGDVMLGGGVWQFGSDSNILNLHITCLNYALDPDSGWQEDYYRQSILIIKLNLDTMIVEGPATPDSTHSKNDCERWYYESIKRRKNQNR